MPKSTEAPDSEELDGTGEEELDSREDLAPEAEEYDDETGTTEEVDSQEDVVEDDESDSLTADSDEEEEEELDWRQEAEKAQEEAKRLAEEADRAEKRRQDTFNELQRRTQELKKFEKFQDVPLDEAVDVYKRSQKQVQPWEPESPERPQFEEAQRKYDIYERQLRQAQATGPEEIERVQQYWQSEFTEQDLANLRNWQKHQQEFGRKFAQAPRQTMQQMIQEEARAELQKMLAYQREQARYSEFFQQEDVQQVMQSNKDDFAELMHRGYLPEEAMDIIRGRNSLRQQSENQAEVVKKDARARERERLSKANATVDRDVQASDDIDIVAEAKRIAKERDITIDTGNADFLRILHQLEEKYLE